MNVLLLNANYRPLNVVATRRAIGLLERERVLPATEDVIAIRSPSTVIDVPCVLALRRYVNVPRRGARWSKRGVLERDGYTCAYCGMRAGEQRSNRVIVRVDFSVDHVVPRSRGGHSTWGNTVCACRVCNHRKGNRLPHEAGMRLRWEPKTPRTSYLVARGDIPASWKVYLEAD